jgi:hypothetical protein
VKLISDNRLARESMDWVPAVSLDEGLLRTIEFVRIIPDFYGTDASVKSYVSGYVISGLTACKLQLWLTLREPDLILTSPCFPRR